MSSAVHIALGARAVDEARLREIAEWGWRHCPVDDAIRRAVPTTVQVEVS